MYNKQLATIHQQWYGGLAQAAAQQIKTLLPHPTGPITDLGCGGGNLLKHFAPTVAQGYGTDVSAPMVALARAEVPQYAFTVCDLWQSPLHPSQVVAMTGEIICYAAYGLEQPEHMIPAFFSRVAKALTTDGLFMFDFLVSGHDFNYSRYHDGPEVSVFTESKAEGNTVTRQIVTYLKEATSGLYSKATETHRQRTFEVQQMHQWLAAAGLEVAVVDHYANQPLLPGRRACLCRKAS